MAVLGFIVSLVVGVFLSLLGSSVLVVGYGEKDRWVGSLILILGILVLVLSCHYSPFSLTS